MGFKAMRKCWIGVASACTLAAPAHAGDWRSTVQTDFHNSTATVRPGAFMGARFVTSFGTRSISRAQISLAPSHSRISQNGLIKTRIGEGLALNFGATSKPTLTIAGTRADVVLGLNQRGSALGDKKLGMSTGGWVAIGLVTAGVVGYVAFAAYVSEKEEGAD